MEAIPQFMGVRIPRREDPELVTGHGRYVDDVPAEDVLFMAVVRSPYAHAHIRNIDAGAALERESVVAVFTGTDVNPHMAQPLPMVIGPRGYEVFNYPELYPLAEDTVRYVGEPVAVVLAEDVYTAADAVEEVFVEYEQLPAIADPESARDESTPILHDQFAGNLAYKAVRESGDVEAAFDGAAHSVQVRVVNQRLIPNAMEPRAVLAAYEAEDDTLTLYTTTQIPHFVLASVVKSLELDWNQVRVIGPNVGGGFGAKGNVYPEELLTAFAARAVGRPVRWTASRSEDYQATTHGRDQIDTIELAADENGRVQAIRMHGLADVGAYFMRVTPYPGVHTIQMITGTYDVPNVRAEMIGVFTNKLPTEPYRGAGRPEAAYLIERAMDVLADEMDIDPADLRRRNYVQPDQFPYRTATGLTYDTGAYERTLAKALELVEYESLREEQARRRDAGGKLLGIGLASYVESCGPGPFETGEVSVEQDGTVTVRSGTMPNGQGHITSWSQIVADRLQIPLEKVDVKIGDTGEVSRGVGTFGSRSAAVGGSAVAVNAQTIRDKAMQIAAHLLEAAANDMVLKNGEFHVRGAPDRAVSWDKVVEAAYGDNVPDGMDAGLSAEERFSPSDETYPFGTHVCVVEIDPDTGHVEIVRYVSVDDCGNVINPMIVEGQIHGGAAQGIGQALFEGAVYDESANLVTGSLLDYAVPKAAWLPNFEAHRTVTPTHLNPMGVKGIGEAATIGSTPAVVNAVVDALSHLGVRHLDMPLTSERVWKALQGQE